MDYVIPIGPEGSPYLDFALDTVFRFSPADVNVVLAGSTPRHADPRIRQLVPVVQAQPRANAPLSVHAAVANTDAIMEAVCKDFRISDPFIWAADDIFLRRGVTLGELFEESRVARGELRQTAGRSNGAHSQMSRTTADVLTGFGLPTLDYERHTPLVVDKATMLEVLHWARAGTAHKRSLYLNLEYARNRRGSRVEIRPDVKVWKPEDVATLPGEAPVVSVSSVFPQESLRSTLQA